MEMQSLATGRDVMMQVGDAYSGALHIINLPAGCRSVADRALPWAGGRRALCAR